MTTPKTTTPDSIALIVACRYKCQAYTTAKVFGQTGSSTMSPEAAVLRLATKLYGPEAQILVEEVEPCRSDKPGVYRIVAQLPRTQNEAAA